jgi:HSP20 family protein
MVNLTRRDPFMETMPTAGMMNRLMERFFSDPFMAEPGPGVGGLLEEATGMLPLDISEDEKNIVVRASVPGFNKDEIDIECQNGVLSINAEHKEETEQHDERYMRRERRFGSLQRRIGLPTGVKEDQCDAELRNGVLTLRIAKSAEAMPRKIRIKESGGTETLGTQQPPRK